MKSKLLVLLSALSLLTFGCSRENMEPEQEEAKGMTLEVSMVAEPRIAVNPDDSTTPFSLSLKWEDVDQLMLCFKCNGSYYHNKAALIPGTLNSDGKTAKFALTVPKEIPVGAQFDLYGVYQKTNDNPADGGAFLPGTAKYRLEQEEKVCITLDKTGKDDAHKYLGKIRPMLYFIKTGLQNNNTTSIRLALQHSGYVMAMHYKNTGSSPCPMPEYIKLQSTDNTNWLLNGGEEVPGGAVADVDFEFGDNQQTSFSGTPGSALIFQTDAEHAAWMPFYDATLKSQEEVIVYRWVANSQNSVPSLKGAMKRKCIEGGTCFGDSWTDGAYSPKSSVTNGKVYHLHAAWDGMEFKFVSQGSTKYKLNLEADKTTIFADNLDKVTFTCRNTAQGAANEDLTASCTFYRLDNDGNILETLSDNTYTSKTAGTYKFKAKCYLYESEVITVNVQKVTPTQKLLFEEFTGQQCSACPYVFNLVNNCAANPNIVVMAIHMNIPRADVMYVEDGQKIYDYDKVGDNYNGGTPMMLVDRVRNRRISMDATATQIANMLQENNGIGAAIDFRHNSETNKLEAKVKLLSTTNRSNINVAVYLVQNDITATQVNYASNWYHHNHVLRKAAGAFEAALWGEEDLTLNKNKAVEKIYSFDTGALYQDNQNTLANGKSKCAVVVLISEKDEDTNAYRVLNVNTAAIGTSVGY